MFRRAPAEIDRFDSQYLFILWLNRYIAEPIISPMRHGSGVQPMQRVAPTVNCEIRVWPAEIDVGCQYHPMVRDQRNDWLRRIEPAGADQQHHFETLLFELGGFVEGRLVVGADNVCVVVDDSEPGLFEPTEDFA